MKQKAIFRVNQQSKNAYSDEMGNFKWCDECKKL